MTPRGTRPPHLGLVGGPRPAGPSVDSLIDSGGRELLAEDDPVAAETWASGLFDVFEGVRWQARLDRLAAVPPFEESLLERCRQRHDKRAAAVAAALAGVVPPPHDQLAAAVATQLRSSVAGLPDWVRRVGHAAPTRSWLASDVFGDQDSLIVGFDQEGSPGEHALLVLVDHNLSGQAKDAWIGADLDAVVAAWRKSSDPHMRLEEIPVDDALGRLRDAMAMSDLWNGDTELRTEDFARHRALVWARLRRAGLGDDLPGETGVVGPPEREAQVRQFMASSYGGELSERCAGVDVELLVRHLVDLRFDYEGRPLRWSPTVVSLVLGDLAPRKLLLDADEAAALPAVVRAFVRFSADRTDLDRTFVDEVLAAVDAVEPEFLERIGDPAAAGPAKAVLATLRDRGVDLSDVDAINEALSEIGPIQLPQGTTRKGPKSAKRRRSLGAPVDVVASAARAPVLGHFGTLAGFYGGGRKLTQTGRPTLGDARQLVALLGTRDQIDPVIGDRTFQTRSAAELPELGFTIRWALAAGALRKEHGKLRATASWGNLDDKPLERWAKAADALSQLGPLDAYKADNRYRERDQILDQLAPGILRGLLAGPAPFDEVLDWVCERADAEYEWLSPHMQEPDHRRRWFLWDLDLLARVLGWAGIADRAGARVEPDPYERDRLVGGTLQLTTVGRWWLETP